MDSERVDYFFVELDVNLANGLPSLDALKQTVNNYRNVFDMEHKMPIRTKFRLDEKTETSNGFSLKFSAVIGDSEENKSFFKGTPSGQVTVNVVNPKCADQFKVGKEYCVDFTAVRLD